MPEAPATAAGRTDRRFVHAEFPAERVAALKAGRRVSVCIPARDEASTLGDVVRAVRTLSGPSAVERIVDEVIVVDDGSTDDTAAVALAAGATVIANRPEATGKGQAMGRALEASKGDLLVFVDADVTSFGAHFVTGLLGPLLADDGVKLVKAHYRRPIDGERDGGGRVTELVARPVIDLLFPDLGGILQPLAGETAAPREVLERCGLADGYAVELALLVDVAARYGADSVAQVDLGVRAHRNRPLSELRPQATDILRAALERSGRRPTTD